MGHAVRFNAGVQYGLSVRDRGPLLRVARLASCRQAVAGGINSRYKSHRLHLRPLRGIRLPWGNGGACKGKRAYRVRFARPLAIRGIKAPTHGWSVATMVRTDATRWREQA
jgi:hypothetical protein